MFNWSKNNLLIFTYQWWSRGGAWASPLLILDQTEALRAEKSSFGDCPPARPTLSQGLDPALHVPRARLSIYLSVPLFSLDDIL